MNLSPNDFEKKLLNELKKQKETIWNKWSNQLGQNIRNGIKSLEEKVINSSFVERLNRIAEEQFSSISSEQVDKRITPWYEKNLEHIEVSISNLTEKFQLLAKQAEEHPPLTEEGASNKPAILNEEENLIALVSINQKAIAQIGEEYGFCTNTKSERKFALLILDYASCVDKISKDKAHKRLMKHIRLMTAHKNITEESTNFDIFKRIAHNISIQLIKAKFQHLIPVKGSIIGTKYNAYFSEKVLQASKFAFRQRFLAEKYGISILEENGLIPVKKENKNED